MMRSGFFSQGHTPSVPSDDDEGVFLPTHTTSNPCTGKVFTVEIHRRGVEFVNPGDNVGLNIKGLDKSTMLRS
eukprot:6467983-Karenia_brevis.AAC.1